MVYGGLFLSLGKNKQTRLHILPSKKYQRKNHKEQNRFLLDPKAPYSRPYRNERPGYSVQLNHQTPRQQLFFMKSVVHFF